MVRFYIFEIICQHVLDFTFKANLVKFIIWLKTSLPYITSEIFSKSLLEVVNTNTTLAP